MDQKRKKILARRNKQKLEGMLKNLIQEQYERLLSEESELTHRLTFVKSRIKDIKEVAVLLWK